jgi:hypothetical protein
MQPDLIDNTYEAINNPILRLLIFAIISAVIALSGAVVYLFKKVIAMNEDNIKALYGVSEGLEKISDHLFK